MGDAGAADPRLAQAMAAYDGTPAARAELLAALAGARIFVAVTAKPTAKPTAAAEHSAPGTGLRAESGAELALLSVVASDGQRAVPGFIEPAALRRWRPDARPVPVAAQYLARAALDDGAVAVLLDPDGAAVAVHRAELETLAAGYVPVAGAALSTRRTTQLLTPPASRPDPGLVTALAEAVGPERLRAARLLEGPGGPVLGIAPRRPLDPAALAAVAQRVMARLGSALPSQGLDLAVVPPKGPGYPLLTRRGR